VCEATITTNAGERVFVLVTIVCSVCAVNRDVTNRTEAVEKRLGIVNKTRMPMVIARERFRCEKFNDEAYCVFVNVDKTMFFARLGVFGRMTSY